jgi:outer membrane lipoprotein
MKRMLLFVVAPLLLLLGGCSHVLSRDALLDVDPTVDFAQVKANPDAYKGKTLLLGGLIIDTRLGREGTTLEVLRYTLNRWGEPQTADEVGGRFLARTGRLLDPELYKAGLFVTLTGTVEGVETRPLQNYDYAYPVFVWLNTSGQRQWTALITIPSTQRIITYYPYYHSPFYYDPFWLSLSAMAGGGSDKNGASPQGGKISFVAPLWRSGSGTGRLREVPRQSPSSSMRPGRASRLWRCGDHHQLPVSPPGPAGRGAAAAEHHRATMPVPGSLTQPQSRTLPEEPGASHRYRAAGKKAFKDPPADSGDNWIPRM